MKKGVSVCFMLLLLIVVPSVSATTGLIIKTQPGHTAYVNILEPTETYQLVKVFREYTGDGSFSIDFDEGKRSKVNILIVLKKDDVRVDEETFKDIPTGGVKELTLLPDDWVEPEPEVEELVEETAVEEETPIEETVEELAVEEPIVQITPTTTEEETNPEGTTPITGEVISENTQEGNTMMFYAIFIIAVAGIVLFIFGYKIFRAKGVVPDNSHISFKQPKKEQKAIEAKADETELTVTERLAAAEKKLKEAQAEIAQIKNRDKIEAAERKLKEDQDRLEKMKQGVDVDEPKEQVKPFRDFSEKPKF